MKPTPTTAAMAGTFSALAWPLLWPWLGDTTTSSSVWLVVGTLVLIALPAHAFVVGFTRNPMPGARAIDTALLKRVGVWLGAAALTSFVMSLLPPT
ncbi:MAG: hypothetical protein KA439_12575 [Rhizobacter sp.]|jgi:hypothetical protein|nr:hypothetical protein [Rhizobacter sp.]MBP6270391.1 hypothetical protein [Rhizobacter sp.]